MSFKMIFKTSNFLKNVLKHAMMKLLPKREWKCVTILIKQQWASDQETQYPCCRKNIRKTELKEIQKLQAK